MFGNPMRIELDGIGVTLRPPKKDEMGAFAELFSSMEVQRYLQMTGAVTEDNELEWWKKTSNDSNTVLWGIVPDGCDVSVGNTALHGLHPFWESCTSGIVISNREYWGKGIAYRCHLARTWYAVKVLNRSTIQSMVRVPNEASLKALLKVGYRLSGKYDRNVFRDGVYLDTYIVSWVNPYKTELLYPEGVPEELNDSLTKAKNALELADKSVKFL